MRFGSESKPQDQEQEHLGECRTLDDVRRLFDRYRAEARLHAEITGEDEPLTVPGVEAEDERLVKTP
jgi:hypothetical protein